MTTLAKEGVPYIQQLLSHPPYHTNAADMLVRYNALTARLAKWKLRFREDSKLQQRYVRYGLDSLDEVVRTACEMEYLYKYTDFAERLEEAVLVKREDEGAYFAGIYMHCSNALRSSYTMPTVWPWMTG